MIVVTAVMVLLAAPVVAVADSAAGLVVLVERAAAPAVDPVLRKAHKAAPVVDRIAGIVLPDPAEMVALRVDATAGSVRPHRPLRRCRKSI